MGKALKALTHFPTPSIRAFSTALSSFTGFLMVFRFVDSIVWGRLGKMLGRWTNATAKKNVGLLIKKKRHTNDHGKHLRIVLPPDRWGPTRGGRTTKPVAQKKKSKKASKKGSGRKPKRTSKKGKSKTKSRKPKGKPSKKGKSRKKSKTPAKKNQRKSHGA